MLQEQYADCHVVISRVDTLYYRNFMHTSILLTQRDNYYQIDSVLTVFLRILCHRAKGKRGTSA